MKSALVLALLPLNVGATPPLDAPVDEEVPVKRVSGAEISIEDLAHSFLFHSSRQVDALPQLISPDGARQIDELIARHKREMNDPKLVAAKLGRMCTDLQSAIDLSAYAALLEAWDMQERFTMRQAARLILAALGESDRRSLEEYLDTEFRQKIAYSRIDYRALLGSEALPSARTRLLSNKACALAAEAETRAQQ